MTFAYTSYPSPVGTLKLVASDDGLAAILWENDDPDRVRLGAMDEDADHPVLAETQRQLGDYFAGKRTHFDLPLDFHGTDFQKSVWAALLTIPLARRALMPRSRASSADRPLSARWVRRTARTRSRSSRHAIA